MKLYTNPAGNTVAVKEEMGGAIAALVTQRGRKIEYQPFAAGPSVDALVESLQLKEQS